VVLDHPSVFKSRCLPWPQRRFGTWSIAPPLPADELSATPGVPLVIFSGETQTAWFKPLLYGVQEDIEHYTISILTTFVSPAIFRPPSLVASIHEEDEVSVEK